MNEKYAIKWLENHGFEYEIKKQYMSKTVFELTKDGLTYKWELPYGVTDMRAYMEQACGFTHKMRVELERLEGARA